MNPRVGETVHYLWCSSPTVCHAAVVTEVRSGGVRGMMAIHPSGTQFIRDVPYGSLLGNASTPPGTWHGMDECGPVSPVAAVDVG